MHYHDIEITVPHYAKIIGNVVFTIEHDLEGDSNNESIGWGDLVLDYCTNNQFLHVPEICDYLACPVADCCTSTNNCDDGTTCNDWVPDPPVCCFSIDDCTDGTSCVAWVAPPTNVHACCYSSWNPKARCEACDPSCFFCSESLDSNC